jgi:diguanylate cyclase (GGDEF)-like protein
MINGKKIVALCTYRIYDPQLFEFVKNFNELLKAHGCQLFIYTMNTEIGNAGDYRAEALIYNRIPYDITDAVVIMDEKIKCPEIVRQIIATANENNVPAVVVDGKYEGASYVHFDYGKGFEAVVRHIIEQHHVRKPHFMAGKKHSAFSRERLEVFKKVIAENGIEFDDSMVSHGEFWALPARAAAEEILKRDELPEAIICANDIMALNVCDVCEAHGISTPEDIIVSGFDGIDEAFLSTPGLTTAKCNSMDLSNAVTDVLEAVFRGERNIEKSIEPRFVANESCGCPRNMSTVSGVSGLNNRFYHHQDDIHVLQELMSEIMLSGTIEEGVNHIRETLFENMCLVVWDACFQVDKNFFLEDMKKSTMSIVYNSYNPEDTMRHFDESSVIPNLAEIMEKGYPLIFNGLDYMGKSIGFICFSYDDYDLIAYTKTPSIANSMSMGIGGFITTHYQEFLRNKIQRMYQNDALTGLYNRIAFMTKFEEFKDEPGNIGQKLTIIMCDLNGLKQINDNLGHTAGDKAIATVAKTMKNVCPNGTLCVRFGGDEMLALVPGEYEGSDIIEQMEKRLELESEKLGYKVSASYGAYSTRFDDILDMDAIIGIADNEMYKMKKERKKRA